MQEELKKPRKYTYKSPETRNIIREAARKKQIAWRKTIGEEAFHTHQVEAGKKRWTKRNK